MGGKFTIILVGGSQNLLNESFELLAELEQKWSRFISSSELTKLNNAEGSAVEVSDETVKLIQAMIQATRLTNGYFDPTTLPLLVKSGYESSRKDPENKTILPSSANWPGDVLGIEISGNKIQLPMGTVLDPGGIGKGLAADFVIDFLKKSEVAGALINANGDVVAFGQAPQPGPWIVGIENPLDSSQEYSQIRLVSGAIATSSRVHQTWKLAGKDIHHIVNPLTGSIAITPVLSATVICAKGADAEALAKIPFILESSEAISFIENLGAQVFIIDENLQAHKSNGWDDFK